MAAATSSIGRDAWLEKTIGTPSAAAARPTATSASRWARPSTPIGPSSSGAGMRRPNSSTEVSRADTSRSTRGTIRQASNPARLAAIVASAPAPPAMYA